MISKSQICIGARIVENDPEEQAPFLISKYSINSPFHSKNVMLLL